MAVKSLNTNVRRAPAQITRFGRPEQWLIGGALALCLTAATAYVFWPRFDDKAALDRQITEQWLPGHEVVDALEFFDTGGVYKSHDGSTPAEIDKTYVIPLIKRLKEEHRLPVVVVVNNIPEKVKAELGPRLRTFPKTAMAILAEVPTNDRAQRNKIRATINEEADKFPGFAWQNWSHRYVSIDYFDEVEKAVFENSGSLQRLQASQRELE